MTQTKTQIESAARVLGVAPNAAMPVVKRAYRMQVKAHHPDMVATSGGAASSAFLSVLDAFQILCDPVLRAEYDRQLAEQRAAKAAAPLKPEPPRSRAVALARGAFALFQLGFYAAVSLLLLLIAIVAAYQIATGH
jgi:curved DNA-binding protein CbpA